MRGLIIKDFLHGTNGREHKMDWLPPYFQFPPKAYTTRGGTLYVVEVERSGTIRAVAPAVESYEPSDAQIAAELARFIEHVREVSNDPVVVKQNWLKAYDYATDRAAQTLNDYARENDPFP